MNCILVTGGAGFIGSNFILHTCEQRSARVVNLDLLTYAGNPTNLASLAEDPSHVLVPGDIGDGELVSALLVRHRPWAVVNFAAESHVDRSIHGPAPFIDTNVVGTFHLLESVRAYWERLAPEEREAFRFLHVSTDEVYGSLASDAPAFTEITPYAPNSPYAASKAASDHLVRAYHHTYGVPTLITNCSNNYGPYQHPEKLIPLMICSAVAGQPLPVYGDGLNVRDWLFVRDHCEAIWTVLEQGAPGETYNIGGQSEHANIDVVNEVCRLMDEFRPDAPHVPHRSLITFVSDRPGHDRRYAIDAAKLMRTLGWAPRESFASGLRKTVAWYLQHGEWVETARSGAYRDWMDLNYGDRLGGNG
jgi:dTDP-glucose 4,6-dehydratase